MTPQTNQLTALFLYAVLSQYTPQCTLQSRRAVKFTGSDAECTVTVYASCFIPPASRKGSKERERREEWRLKPPVFGEIWFGNRGKTRYRMFENIRVSVKADRGEDYDSHPEKLGKCHEVWTRIKRICAKIYSWGIPESSSSYSKAVQDSIKSLIFLKDYPITWVQKRQPKVVRYAFLMKRRRVDRGKRGTSTPTEKGIKKERLFVANKMSPDTVEKILTRSHLLQKSP
ncbi:hypothetical protein F5876DRAFT_66180 [Lentinula aff. lateritia]|uniref:Uncharacterized protein n=1 Tax=Lentinula aff. lateritia TaxID=2804960 RepID=A0ACC1TZ55_9AGAR|nr:hypothetical protein F5876DRAFT_66180 [Lentinula aff. lateritia]